MSEKLVNGCPGLVDDCHVYDFDESIRASKYPMAVDVSKCSGDVTKTVLSLGRSGKGEGHDNFLSGILVSMDLALTNKAWVEAERYHFLQIVSSQSTMHRIANMDLEKCVDERVDPDIIYVFKDYVEVWKRFKDEGDEELAKLAYLKILYNIPSGLKLTARVTTNYRALKTIYSQRHNHRLPEWRELCEWMRENLPMFKELVLGETD